MNLLEWLKVLELVTKYANEVDVVIAGGKIVSTTYPISEVIPAGGIVTYQMPLHGDYMIIGDWLDIDISDRDVTVQYYRDGILEYQYNRNIKAPPINYPPAYDIVEIKIINNSSSEQYADIAWHYVIAVRELYEGFVTGVNREMSDLIEKIARGLRGEKIE